MQACGCALLLVGKRVSGRHHFAGLLAAINRRSCQLLNAANCAGVVQRFSAGLIQPPDSPYSPHAVRLLFLQLRSCCKSLGKQTHATQTQGKQRCGVVGLCSTDEETSGSETPFTIARFPAATSPEVGIRRGELYLPHSSVTKCTCVVNSARFGSRFWCHFLSCVAPFKVRRRRRLTER